ncbi:MAG: CCA tRNA nucleotidyltransferase [Verrucomicrobiota bacterium]
MDAVMPNLVPLDHPAGAAVRAVAQQVAKAGGRARLVGGCVRDALLGCAAKDLDVEVYGLEADRLEALLRERFAVATVGRSFGVFLLKEHGIDVALPRRETKQGSGHKGFAVEGDPTMTPREAAARRDFTINAILWDPLSGEVLDPFDGRSDLRRGLIRHTSEQFAKDPLRVLRAMQFTGRFEFPVAPATVALCRRIEPEGLPAERLFDEWKKLILKGRTPSMGLFFLRDCGWLRYFPELEALVGCPQEPDWHPEGDVFIHTALCLDAFARARTGEEFEDLVVGFAVLCHDMGKPEKTEFFDGRIRSHEHEQAGEAPARSFLERLTRHKKLIEEVLPLVREHMRPRELFLSGAGDSAIRRLARRVKRIDRLIRVSAADMNGRFPLPAHDFEEGEWLQRKAEQLAVKDAEPEPIIKGRHLIEQGLQPSPAFKQITDACYEAQIEGAFHDLEGAKAYLRDHLAENPQ